MIKLADYDYRVNGYNAGNLLVPDHPATIPAMKTALTTFNATSYTPARLFTMNYNDLIYACKLHGLSVTTTL